MHQLDKYMVDNNLSLRELATKVGVHYSTLSRVIKNQIGVSRAVSNKIKIATGIKIAPRRLRRKEDNKIAELNRSIEEQEKILGIEKRVETFDMDTTEKRNMYIVPVKAFGGFVSGSESPVFMNTLKKVEFPFVKGDCFAFEVEGLCMYKDYLPGDYVVGTPVEKFEWITKGKVYIFQTNDAILLRCFERIEDDCFHLKCINTEFPSTQIPVSSVTKIYFKEKLIK
jgi:SOS-response transcriptional repressor LexA